MLDKIKTSLLNAWSKIKERVTARWKEIIVFMLVSWAIAIAIPAIFKFIGIKFAVYTLIGIISSNVCYVLIPDTIKKIFKLKK
jgi:hypothetical protein